MAQARKYVCEGLSTCTPPPPDSPPLWHSAVFQKGSHLTYYCPALINLGILTVGDLFDAAGDPISRHLRKMGPTWVPVFQQGLRWVQGMPQSDWSIPSAWIGAWGKCEMLNLLARVPFAEHRQSCETWKVFRRTRFPPFLRDFIFAALWRSLKIGEHLMNWTHEP